MHQQSRHPPRLASPASSPQTNPARTNNPRDRGRHGSDATTPGADSGSETPGSQTSGPSRDSIRKLDQIIQNFYTKAAVLILQSRLETTPVGGKREDGKKQNRWFSIDTDDIEDCRDELRVYRLSGSFENRPPPMIIETYIDASKLSSSLSLVIVDDNGKRWDVLEALNSSDSSDDSPRRRGHAPQRNTEVILERWRLELKCLPDVDRDEFGPTLPTVYKRSIVFFRSLFVTTRIMPCWKYSQQNLSNAIGHGLEVKCRVLTAEPEYTTYDPLRQPLHDGRDPVTEYVFTDLEVPVGRFYASVTYRNDCNFRVESAEAIISSRLIGDDENYFRPSVQQRRDHGRPDLYAEPGSLPSHRHGRAQQEPQQTYGSLSTFHGAGAFGTSPITALRAVRPIGSDTSSPPSSSASLDQADPPHSLPIRGATARPALRTDASSRRPSVSFQPFKAGSLSGSPRISDAEVPSSPQSLSRPSLAGPSRTGNRSSLHAGMAASLRGAPSAPQEVPSVTGSPRPASRFSSSFTHRRGRPSFGGQSKGDDDQASSGKQSLSSSAQPGSGLLAEAGAITSSGSFAADDDNISDFLKALDSRKTLKSFEPNRRGESLASKRTAAQLSKFQQMRETNNVLTESMTSSIHLQRSSISSSSRQLANVPSMVAPAAASMSISSSPGKPLSPHTPHTPHTPAIPSRLSENSIIDYHPQDHQPRRAGRRTGMAVADEEAELAEDDDVTPRATQQERAANNPSSATAPNTAGGASSSGTGTTAIDIPLSPRLLHHGGVATHQAAQQRSIAGQVAAASGSGEGPGGSVSVGGSEDGRGVLGYQRGTRLHRRTESSSAPSVEADGLERGEGEEVGGAGLLFRGSGSRGSGSASARGMRYLTSGLRGGTRPGSFSGTTAATTAPPGVGTGGRYAGSVEGADEEPLLFAMSELERDSRRSLEEGRGRGGQGLVLPLRRGGQEQDGVEGVEGDEGYETRGIQRKGW
ncbi:putative autophagy protein [Staphylotrichum tortipilum]|uniref:Autophagy-related protein 13 n=1 Tax=Staphylotrichum tortipilum TaxID=2831512 RepID=A0AAN6RQZ6_9PEZI|nr:putative autophagy protein [Staphylotrichum longicolle]